MCIGMSWPPLSEDGNAILERLGLGPPSGLAHGDMHNANGNLQGHLKTYRPTNALLVMIGSEVMGDPEHDISPPLKLIDFGCALEYPG
jgi:hypothetical protein